METSVLGAGIRTLSTALAAILMLATSPPTAHAYPIVPTRVYDASLRVSHRTTLLGKERYRITLSTSPQYRDDEQVWQHWEWPTVTMGLHPLRVYLSVETECPKDGEYRTIDSDVQKLIKGHLELPMGLSFSEPVLGVSKTWEVPASRSGSTLGVSCPCCNGPSRMVRARYKVLGNAHAAQIALRHAPLHNTASIALAGRTPHAPPGAYYSDSDEVTRYHLLIRRRPIGLHERNRPPASPKAPEDSEILRSFQQHYHPYDPGSSRVHWKGRDNQGTWWAVVGLGPDEVGDLYSICGYREEPGRWIVQDVQGPGGVVYVNEFAPPSPPHEVIRAMESAGLSVYQD